MVWTARIRDAEYTSASGVTTVFDFQQITNTPVKKSSVYMFGNVAGAFVQNFGLGSRTFSLRAFLHGADYDIAADTFLTSLEESGIGFFTHPLQGRKTVVATAISRRDDLVNSAGQAVFDLSFIETLETLFPTPLTSQSDFVRSSIIAYDTSAPVNFDDTITLVTTSETANFKTSFDNTLNAANEILSRTMASDQLRDFQSAINGIKNGLDALADDPQDLATQTIQAIRLTTSLNDLSDFAASRLQITETTVDNEDVNNKSINKLFAFSSVVTMANETVDMDFKNRGESITTAVFLESQERSVVDWNDTENASLGVVRADNSYADFHQVIARESGRLVANSFDLPIERSIITDKQRSVIDLASELYNSDNISFVNDIINENNLIGEEIISVPAGRRIRFYR